MCDFDKIVERASTGALKWSGNILEKKFGNRDALPMWIADMDFKTAEPVIRALKERAEHGIFGYSENSDEFFQSCVDWQRKRNGWEISKEWILFSQGVVPALNKIVGALCKKGDGVIVQSPVYYPFYSAIKSNGCMVADNPLRETEQGYEMDFEGLEKLAKATENKLLILCNPHNPVGRAWKEDELRRLGKICFENGVKVVVDEIHADLVYKPRKHLSFGSLGDEFAQNSVICTAPSKTFNIAGLQISDIIAPNPEIRDVLVKVFTDHPNSFASVAQVAAYTEGEEWLAKMLEYVEGNLRYIEGFLKERLPKVKFRVPEATYLAWLDFRAYGLSQEELKKKMALDTGVALDDGEIFGAGGIGFLRLNGACPRSVIQDAMLRMEKIFK